MLGGGFTPTGIAMGAGGAGLGEWLKEKYEVSQGLRDEINYPQVGVQTVIGAVPFTGKAPGVGATAAQWAKYGKQLPFRTTAEGFVLGSAATVPTQLAETGEMPSAGQALAGGASSAVFGLGGGLLGARSARSNARRLSEPQLPAVIPPNQGGVPPPTGGIPPPRPVGGSATPGAAAAPVQETIAGLKIRKTPHGDEVVLSSAPVGVTQELERNGFGPTGRLTKIGGKNFVTWFRPNGTPDAGPGASFAPPNEAFPGGGQVETIDPVNGFTVEQNKMTAALDAEYERAGYEHAGYTPEGNSIYKPIGTHNKVPYEPPPVVNYEDPYAGIDDQFPAPAVRPQVPAQAPTIESVPPIQMPPSSLEVAPTNDIAGVRAPNIKGVPFDTPLTPDEWGSLSIDELNNRLQNDVYPPAPDTLAEQTRQAEDLTRLRQQSVMGQQPEQQALDLGPTPGPEDFQISKMAKDNSGEPLIPSLEDVAGFDAETAAAFTDDVNEAIEYWNQRINDSINRGEIDRYAYEKKAEAEAIYNRLHGFDAFGQLPSKTLTPDVKNRLQELTDISNRPEVNQVDLTDPNVMKMQPPEDRAWEARMRRVFDKEHFTGSHPLDRELARVRQLAPKIMKDAEKWELEEFEELLHSIANDKNTPKDVLEGIPDMLKLLQKRAEGGDVSNMAARERFLSSPEEIQQFYDNIQPVPGNEHSVYISGNRYTPAEQARLENSPHLRNVAVIMNGMLKELDRMFPVGMVGGQRGRTAKFGWFIGDALDGGVNVPNITTGREGKPEFAVMINPVGLISLAETPEEAAEMMAHGILHEFVHNIVRKEDGRYTWQLMRTDAKYGTANRSRIAAGILRAITGADGRYAPEVRGLLREYTESRWRPDVVSDSPTGPTQSGNTGGEGPGGISSSSGMAGEPTPIEQSARDRVTAVGNVPPIKPSGGNMGGSNLPPSGPPPPTGGTPPPAGRKGVPPTKKKPEVHRGREWWNLPRAATTIWDLSAPLRQGLPMLFTKQWRDSLRPMIEALGSEGAYAKQLADIRNRPLFRDVQDKVTKKITKSWASRAGLTMSELGDDISSREEAVGSNWIETGGMFAKIPGGQQAYKSTLGRAARGSNRAYTAFLNRLRADSFESIMKSAYDDFKAGTKGARDPYNDLSFAREIADFVNTATGKGPLRFAYPTNVAASNKDPFKLGVKEYSLEQATKILADGLFAPKLVASRMRMLNPFTYVMADPFVRKQYLKAAISTVGAWSAMSGMAYMAGADVSLDPNSADFGKIRIPGTGTRLDPAGGFQQYFVAISRLITGDVSSSSTGKSRTLGEGFRADTRGDVLERFVANKLHPAVKFAHDMAFASQYQPFQMGDRTIQQFLPLIAQDAIELAREDPSLLPLLAPIGLGMGTQTYDKGEAISKFIKPKNDYVFKGGHLPFIGR